MRVLALLLLAPAAEAQQVDCGRAASQIEMTFCASERFAQADAALNDAYGAAVAEARRGGPAREELLREAQRAWVAYRDAACSAEASVYEGGTIQPMVGTECKTRLTLTRTDDLWLYAGSTP